MPLYTPYNGGAEEGDRYYPFGDNTHTPNLPYEIEDHRFHYLLVPVWSWTHAWFGKDRCPVVYDTMVRHNLWVRYYCMSNDHLPPDYQVALRHTIPTS